MNIQSSFLWFDLETFGTNPRYDMIAQFAAVRTDEQLNIITEPVIWYCQPTADKLPNIEACLVTGITPQYAKAHGLKEYEFANNIFELFNIPKTCGVGYNSIAFDDEFLRHLFYRNLLDPYMREYSFGNSRWDLLNVVRAAYSLRPDGINWPKNDDGISLKLTDLTLANNIKHTNAHDALADVLATISIAKLIKNIQPKLYNYILTLRDKNVVSSLLDQSITLQRPLVHVAAQYGKKNNYIGIILPILKTTNNEYVAINIINLLAKNKLPLVRIAINKLPIIAKYHSLRSIDKERLQLKEGIFIDNINWLKNNYTYCQQQAREFTVYPKQDLSLVHPDARLYLDGFISNKDKSTLKNISSNRPENWINKKFSFEGDNLKELLSFYKARNFIELLGKEQQQSWQDYCKNNINCSPYNETVKLADYLMKIDNMKKNTNLSSSELEILKSLSIYFSLTVFED